jgi:hypothetical protein
MMMMMLGELLDELPEDLARQVFTHASWSERSSDSYTRLAFLGDSVLGLALARAGSPRFARRPSQESLAGRWPSDWICPRGYGRRRPQEYETAQLHSWRQSVCWPP